MNLSPTAKRWLLVLGYVLFIYATLGLVNTPLRFLRAHGLLRLSLLTSYFLCLALSFLILFKTRTKDIWRYVLLLGVFVAAFFIARTVHLPEEQVHFFEYGLVGILYARALDMKAKSNWSLFIGAFVLAGLSGWLDEILQGHIPSRHYDVSDIFLNLVSASLGLLLYACFPSENRIRSSSIQ